MAEKLILIAELSAPHGVRGLMRLRSFLSDPAAVFTLPALQNAAGAPVKVSQRGTTKDGFIVAVDGVASREAADALRGTKLYAPRAALPATRDREFYVDDLVGLAARTEDGKTVGTVTRIIDYGAGPVLEIKREGQAALLLLFNDRFVPVVDVAGGFIIIHEPVEL